MEPYITLYPEQIEHLPMTDQVCRRVLVFPTETAISSEDVAYVYDIIRKTMLQGTESKRKAT